VTDALEQVASLLLSESGICIRGEQTASLDAAIRRLGQDMDASAFLRAVEDPDRRGLLFGRLIDEVTVQETYFFRQPSELAAIDWRLLYEGARAAGSEQVRVWVAACASGEEAYTLAILASEMFGSTEPPVSILATDISESALAKAEKGGHKGRAVRPIDERFRDRYFLRQGDELVVSQRLRRLVRFRRHNLMRDPAPPAGEEPFDLILCRNVLIYFDGATAEQVIFSLERSLREQGTLVLGAADRLCGSIRRLSHLDEEGAAAKARARARKSPVRPVLRRPLGRQVEASPQEHMAVAVQAANEGKLEIVIERTAAVLEENPLDPEAYFIRGLAQLASKDAGAAVISFRRALYVDPNFALAAFKLGRGSEILGQVTAAQRAYQQALRTLDAEGSRHEAILGEIDLGDVAAACRVRIRALRANAGPPNANAATGSSNSTDRLWA
jgi:chemotaxis methyl-accepting protein methylase